MPSKFVKRNFKENGIYHIYNDGVEKILYKDDQDYRVFLFYLYIYTTPKDSVLSKYPDLPLRLEEKNLNEEIKLIGYCLMPGHYHLLIQQIKKDSIQKLMKQLINGYTAYYNQKYEHRGGIFRGRYKSAYIENDLLTIQMWRYIHLNPVMEGLTNHPVDHEWSSYQFFMGEESEFKCSKDLISNFYKSPEDIEKFHTDKEDFERSLGTLKTLAIEKIGTTP